MSFVPGTPTLDQLHVLLAVVETGSFAAAARKLNRSTSVVGYTIANLEAQLGLPLFDRETTRKPQLTAAGRLVLDDARLLVGGIGSLRAKVKGLLQGLEGDLHVVLDSLLPGERVVDALTAFRVAFPTVRLHLHVETLGAVADRVLSGVATIGVSGHWAAEHETLARVAVGSLRMVPVAAPGHPLASPPAAGHAPGAGRGHIQLVVADRSGLTAGREYSVAAAHTWRLADHAYKHMLLKAGIGWGMMPSWMVADDLAASRLVLLAMPDQVAFDYSVDVIYRTDTPPGPAATWLVKRFGEQASGDCRRNPGQDGHDHVPTENDGAAKRTRTSTGLPTSTSS